MKNVLSVQESKIYYPAMLSSSKLTQALSAYKNRKVTGEGIVVSVLDTGIDTQHKDMRLSNPENAKIKSIKSSDQTTYTAKVPYGYNFADNNDLVKDDETVGKSEHGMHVAGIIAANGKDDEVSNLKAIKGVAPEAQLLAMKVFSNNPKVKGCYDDDIVAAIEDSVKHEADIINMSLGSPMGFTNEEDPVAKAVKSAREAGVLVLIAAGNEMIPTTSNSNSKEIKNDLGFKDFAIIGSPSTSDDAFSIASCNNNKITTTKAIYKTGEDKEVETQYGHVQGDLPLEFVELADGKLAKPDELKNIDFAGKYALIERGDLSFAEKVDNAANKGAKGVILYNYAKEADQIVRPNIDKVKNKTIPVLTILRADALALLNGAKAGKKMLFKATEDNIIVADGDSIVMSPFTSWGPTQDLEFKPELTAPGGNIYSTVNNNKYDTKSGTSMATPHAAGLSALLYGQAKSMGLSGADLSDYVKIALMNTARYYMIHYTRKTFHTHLDVRALVLPRWKMPWIQRFL